MPQIVATPQPTRVRVVTIVAAINDPRAVRGKVRLKLSPRSQAITVPVQTPVIGRLKSARVPPRHFVNRRSSVRIRPLAPYNMLVYGIRNSDGSGYNRDEYRITHQI